MSGDPVQHLLDEITALRRSVEHLARTSLDKDEAQALHQIVAKAALDMRKAVGDAPETLGAVLKHDRDQMALRATESATRAAQKALHDIREDLSRERQTLAQAAGEARREAWRWFGGFWVWIASMLATGALLGALAAFWIGGTISARDFGDYPRVFCSAAGGQRVTQDDGSSFCAIWIDRPDQGQ